ncbi:MAG: TIGR04255 family protein [Alphaproteobacteria bacterium]
MTSIKNVNFKTPPIMEVACAVFFEPLPKYTSVHSGVLWMEKFEKDYPKTEDKNPIAPQSEAETKDYLSNFPFMQRAWFVDKSKGRLIQVQNNAFLYNWQKTEGQAYPRYSDVMDNFKKNFNDFKSFIEAKNLGELNITGLELVYVNHLKKGVCWKSKAELVDALPTLTNTYNRQTSFLSEPESVQSKLLFNIPDNNGRLHVGIRSARQEENDLIVLDLSAKYLGTEYNPDNFSDWFDSAHNMIIQGFLDLTGKSVQKEQWGRNDTK